MTEATPLPGGHGLSISWDDGTRTDYPWLWLRDNCPSAWHELTREKTLDLLSLPEEIRPAALRLTDGHLCIDWAGEDRPSRIPLDWLDAHRPGRARADAAAIAPRPWRTEDGDTAIARAEAAALLTDDAALLGWLGALKTTGLGIVGGLAPDREAGMELARRIGFLRETNFGRSFEVVSKPDPNNLAYTADALALHTDLPNQELPPGFQFLHCLANAAQGGDSVFADGFAIAEDLRGRDPDAFGLLARTAIPFRFHDRETDIRWRRRVISTDADGRIGEICWNAHIADVFDLPTAELATYYRAYRAFMAMTRERRYRVALRLASGEMAVFDNRRVLHGRSGFDPATGRRHLRGCYVDRGEVDSRIRVLSRGLSRPAPPCTPEEAPGGACCAPLSGHRMRPRSADREDPP